MVVPALIAGGAAIMGGMMSASSQNKANESNIQIAQMNNEFNERMLQKQMDYNTEMWNKQNEYNTPANQRKRYEEAGLNPYLAMQNGDAGMAQSAGGINPPTATDVKVQPVDGMATAVGQAAQTYLDYKMGLERHNAEIEQIHIENQHRARKLMAEIADKEASARSHEAKANLDKTMEGLNKQIADADVRYKNRLSAVAEQEAEIKMTENLMKRKELAIFDERWNIEKAAIVAQTLNYSAQAGLSKQQTRHEVYKALYTQYKAQGEKHANRIAQRIANYVVEEAGVKADMSPFIYGPSSMYQATYGIGYQADRNHWKSNNR